MSELAWFPLYVDRFLRSRKIRAMSLEEVGAYIILLCEQWEGGPIQDNDAQLSAICHGNLSAARAVLELCFSNAGNGWENAELLDILHEQVEKHEKKVQAGRTGGKQKASNALAELEQGSTNKNKKKKEITKRKTSFPNGWQPNERHAQAAESEGVDMDREAAKFEDYSLANGKKYLDWDRAFHNWLRNAGEYRRKAGPEKKTYHDPATYRL